MKKLIDLLQENGTLLFKVQNIIRLVKCLDEEFQPRAIEILLGQEDYCPGLGSKYYEKDHYKHWFKGYNLLTDRVEYTYVKLMSKKIKAPKSVLARAIENGFQEAEFIWDNLQSAVQFFHNHDEELEGMVETQIDYWGPVYDSHMYLKQWMNECEKYREQNIGDECPESEDSLTSWH